MRRRSLSNSTEFRIPFRHNTSTGPIFSKLDLDDSIGPCAFAAQYKQLPTKPFHSLCIDGTQRKLKENQRKSCQFRRQTTAAPCCLLQQQQFRQLQRQWQWDGIIKNNKARDTRSHQHYLNLLTENSWNWLSSWHYKVCDACVLSVRI